MHQVDFTLAGAGQFQVINAQTICAEELKAAEESVQKEGGEGAASAAAAEQLRVKKRKVLEIEQEAGRMGGDKGRRIVYDDAAIEKLLDRWAQSELSNPLEG